MSACLIVLLAVVIPIAANLEASANAPITEILGVSIHPETGELLLIGESQPGRMPIVPGLFAAAAPGVFLERQIAVSIEPLQPGRPTKHQVLYYAVPKGSLFAWILFECDRRLKALSMGEDNVTRTPFGIDGVPTMFDLSFADKKTASQVSGQAEAHRLWFEPAEMVFEESADGLTLAVTECRLKVSAENLNGRGNPSAPVQQFADFVTEHYDTLSRSNELDVLKDLEELTKVVGIMRWIRAKHPPVSIEGLLLASTPPHETPEDTPVFDAVRSRTTQEGNITSTLSITLYGGVDLNPEARDRVYGVRRGRRGNALADAVRNMARGSSEVIVNGVACRAQPLCPPTRPLREVPKAVPADAPPALEVTAATGSTLVYPPRLSFPIRDAEIEAQAGVPAFALLRDFEEGGEYYFTKHGVVTSFVNDVPVAKAPALFAEEESMQLVRNRQGGFTYTAGNGNESNADFDADGRLLSWNYQGRQFQWRYRRDGSASVQTEGNPVRTVVAKAEPSPPVAPSDTPSPQPATAAPASQAPPAPSAARLAAVPETASPATSDAQRSVRETERPVDETPPARAEVRDPRTAAAIPSMPAPLRRSLRKLQQPSFK